MNLLRLNELSPPPAETETEADTARQLELFAPEAELPPETELRLLPLIGDQRASLIGRWTFLVSLAAHIAAAAFLVTNPGLINFGSPVVVLPKPEERQVTMLYEPPPPARPRQPLQAPPEPPPPPRPAPTLPRAAGSPDSQLDRIQPPPAARAAQPSPPQPPAETPGTRGVEEKGKGEDVIARMNPIGIPNFPEQSREPPRQQPSLENIPKPQAPPPSQAQLRLPTVAPPSRGTDAILRDMARQQAEGGGQLGAGAFAIPDAGDPNFNLPGPQILSDTMGVNFDPYLLRVYLIVQRNWYSVIPEIARLGRKGRTILQFRILKNGSVEGLQMIDGSGTDSMDSAAMSSIRLSNPFPPLPPEFPGNDILLRFGYYYNMRPEYLNRP